MKLTRKLLYASILFFIIIFILNKIIGIKLSNDINDELKRIFLNQNFIFDNTNDIYIYENQINDTQISYHGIKVNPIKGFLEIKKPTLKINQKKLSIKLNSISLRLGYSQIYNIKKAIDSGSIQDVNINEFQILLNDLQLFSKIDDLEISFQEFGINFSGNIEAENIHKIMSSNYQEFNIYLKNLILKTKQSLLSEVSLIDFNLNDISISKLTSNNKIKNSIIDMTLNMETNLLNINFNTSFDNLSTSNIEDINVYNATAILKPIDPKINQLLNNLEMELGAPFPRNNKDDIILDILPGKVGNLRIKGLNFY